MQLVLEAEPKHWQSASSLPTASSSQLHPFARANFGSVNLNLATLQLSRCVQVLHLLITSGAFYAGPAVTDPDLCFLWNSVERRSVHFLQLQSLHSSFCTETVTV